MLVIISNTWLQPKLLHCIVGLQVFPFTYWMACRGWSHSLLRGDWLTMETFFREARSKMSIKAFWSGGIWCQQLLLRIVGGRCRLYLWISCSHRHNVSGKELGFFFFPQCDILRLWAPQTKFYISQCVQVTAAKISGHQNTFVFVINYWEWRKTRHRTQHLIFQQFIQQLHRHFLKKCAALFDVW